MEKKDLKVYEAPAMEVVEMELQGIVCASDFEGSNDEFTDVEIPGVGGLE